MTSQKYNLVTRFNTELNESECKSLRAILDNMSNRIRTKKTYYKISTINYSEQVIGLEITKKNVKPDDESFVGKSIILFTNKLITEPLTQDYPTAVVYLFNYQDYSVLLNRMIAFVDNTFGLPIKDNGYFDVKEEKVSFVSFDETYHYSIYGKEDDCYTFEKGMITNREDAENVQDFTRQLADKLDKVQDLKVLEYIASNESEACYIVVQHFVIPVKKMKISIRNHPINTQSQMVFYLYNYENYDELEDRIISTITDFDWDNYVFNSYKYFDVTKDDILYKRVGDDLEVYSEEQRAYVEDTRKERFNSKMFKPLIVHPSEKELFMRTRKNTLL